MSRSYGRKTSPVFEAVEPRRLFSVSLANGILKITGTSGNDNDSISLSGGSIVVKEGASSRSFSAGTVTKIVADLGAGNDKLTVASSINKPVSVIGGSGNDTITGGSANDTLRGGDGKDSLLGGSGVDLLYGDAGDDMLRSDAGNDKCFGGAGNDVMQGGTGNDNMDGGSGNDTVDYSLRKTPVYAEIWLRNNSGDAVPASQPLAGAGGEGDEGNREEDTYLSVETLLGGSGGDHLSFLDDSQDSSVGNPLRRVLLQGNGGNDELSNYGWRVSDSRASATLLGGEGNDLIDTWGGAVLSKAVGGNGNDTFSFGADETHVLPRVDLGAGTDEYSCWSDGENASQPNKFSVTLPDNVENFTADLYAIGPSAISIIGNASTNKIELVLGAQDDTDPISVSIKSLGGNDTITGSEFAENIDGGAGNDVIHGGAGNDTIIGGSGNDKLFGDAGNDRFFSQDGQADSLDGGSGKDSATRDNIDAIANM